jgi:hypothetical protein
VPFGREDDRLAHGVQVAPAFGQPALALERRAAWRALYIKSIAWRALSAV